MADYKAVMRLLIQQRLYREIENQLGCFHRAVSRANTVHRSHGFTTVEQVEGLTIDELEVKSRVVVSIRGSWYRESA